MEVQDKDLQVDQVVVLVVVNIVKLEEQVMFNLQLQYKDFLVDSHHPHLHPLIQEELVEEVLHQQAETQPIMEQEVLEVLEPLIQSQVQT